MTHNSGRNWINVDFLEFFELLGLYIYVYIFLPDGQAIIYIYTVRDMYLRIEVYLRRKGLLISCFFRFEWVNLRSRSGNRDRMSRVAAGSIFESEVARVFSILKCVL